MHVRHVGPPQTLSILFAALLLCFPPPFIPNAHLFSPNAHKSFLLPTLHILPTSSTLLATPPVVPTTSVVPTTTPCLAHAAVSPGPAPFSPVSTVATPPPHRRRQPFSMIAHHHPLRPHHPPHHHQTPPPPSTRPAQGPLFPRPSFTSPTSPLLVSSPPRFSDTEPQGLVRTCISTMKPCSSASPSWR